MNNPCGYTFQEPVQTCKIMMDWCSMGSQYVSFLRNGHALSPERNQALDHWEYVLQQLAAQARDFLGHSAFYNPIALNQLLQQGHYLKHEFTRFLQAYPLPKVAPDQDPQINVASPADTNAYMGTGLRTEVDPKSPLTSVPIGGHTLPPLPYDYHALEPYIDEKTMRLHHDKHHKSYVDGLNKAEMMMEKARKSGDFELITHWEREAAFNGAGHYLHTMFWDNMKPKDGDELKGTIHHQITKDFGSFSGFKKHFSIAAEKAEAVGWAILI